MRLRSAARSPPSATGRYRTLPTDASALRVPPSQSSQMPPGRSNSPAETLGNYSRTEPAPLSPQISNGSSTSAPYFSPRQHQGLRVGGGSNNSLQSLNVSHGDRLDQVRHGHTQSTSSNGVVSGGSTGQTTTKPSGPRHIASATLRPERQVRSASDTTPARGEGSNGGGDVEREQVREGKMNSPLTHRASRSGLSTRTSRSGRATPHTQGQSSTHPNGTTPHLPSSSARVRLLPHLPHSKDSEVAPTVQMYWSKAPVWGTMPNHGMRAHSVTLVDSVAWIFGGCDERGCWKDLWLFNTGDYVRPRSRVFFRLTRVCLRNNAVVTSGRARRRPPSMPSTHCDARRPEDCRFWWWRRTGLLRHRLRIGHRSPSVAESRIPYRCATSYHKTSSHRRLLRWKDLGVWRREWIASAE